MNFNTSKSNALKLSGAFRSIAVVIDIDSALFVFRLNVINVSYDDVIVNDDDDDELSSDASLFRY